MTDAELVERLRVWFRLKGDLALRQAADRLERFESTLLNISLMDCYARDSEEPVHEMMMRQAKKALE